MTLQSLSDFTSWFQTNGGQLDSTLVGFAEFPDCGRGVVALRDIQEGENLFTLPRSLTLSTHTSSLTSLFSLDAWKSHKLDKNWTGLVLCMLWEAAQGPESKWFHYIASLPDSFETPMFWSEEELLELRGTSVLEKIGKKEAEENYWNQLLPAVKSRPDLFDPAKISSYYSLERYHIMGSLILSRGFEVEQEEQPGDISMGSDRMDTSMEGPPEPLKNSEDDDPADIDEGDIAERETDDSDEEGEEEVLNVAMVPLADMLNARYGCGNAKLFYEGDKLGMVCTKAIKAGDQIWNTYGDLPNTDLLRKYGHIDLISDEGGTTGNPADIVEIKGDLVVQTFGRDPNALKDRIDWWLSQEEDDTFIVETDGRLPDDLISFMHLMMADNSQWEKISRKSKIPKPHVEKPILLLGLKLLKLRLDCYPTTLQQDEDLLKTTIVEPSNRATRIYINALHLRVAEKRILTCALKELEGQLAKIPLSQQGSKRKHEDPAANHGGSKRKK
ncbi:SET domain-containing protein [Sistotremastrum niveocremeum HHB9708]|uniref:SET domain-containing protein n=1 Tax=Sistotremastrum niveocremeum HHB9708 TaxID=1314777 RepID=A0A165A4E2_9AGAM|nr:SET domain-containing protein [Sistotremastrum niveocremeum HHB9708]